VPVPQRARITCFSLAPHERSVIIGTASGAIRILLPNKEHQTRKIVNVLDEHFFGLVGDDEDA
jgi:hypothetical protein